MMVKSEPEILKYLEALYELEQKKENRIFSTLQNC